MEATHPHPQHHISGWVFKSGHVLNSNKKITVPAMAVASLVTLVALTVLSGAIASQFFGQNLDFLPNPELFNNVEVLYGSAAVVGTGIIGLALASTALHLTKKQPQKAEAPVVPEVAKPKAKSEVPEAPVVPEVAKPKAERNAVLVQHLQENLIACKLVLLEVDPRLTDLISYMQQKQQGREINDEYLKYLSFKYELILGSVTFSMFQTKELDDTTRVGDSTLGVVRGMLTTFALQFLTNPEAGIKNLYLQIQETIETGSAQVNPISSEKNRVKACAVLARKGIPAQKNENLGNQLLDNLILLKDFLRNFVYEMDEENIHNLSIGFESDDYSKNEFMRFGVGTYQFLIMCVNSLLILAKDLKDDEPVGSSTFGEVKKMLTDYSRYYIPENPPPRSDGALVAYSVNMIDCMKRLANKILEIEKKSFDQVFSTEEGAEQDRSYFSVRIEMV